MDDLLTPIQVKAACATINEFIGGEVDVKAVPADNNTIAWVRVYPQGEYPFAKNEAFQRLVQAGYNPQRLLDFAIGQAKKGRTISADEARFIAVNDFGFNPKSAAVTLRKAAERGRDGKGAVIATSTAVGWQYHEDALRAWLSDPAMHKRGPEPRSTQAETDILDNR